MIELIAGIAYFFFVFFKAFQQKNVAFDHYWPIMPISFMMGLTEVVAKGGVSLRVGLTLFGVSPDGEIILDFQWEKLTELLPMIFAIGIGGGFGSILAMYLHNNIFRRKK